MDKIYLDKFGAETYQTYDFENVASGNRAFGTAIASLSSLVGQDGGTDQFGTGVAPFAKGNIPVEFWIDAQDEENMTAKRDTALSMPNWGVQPLFLLPFNKTYDRRWCWARCTSVNMPDDAASCSYLLQRVDATFQIADPRWESHGTLWFLGEDSYILDDGMSFLGSKYVDILSGTTQDVQVTNLGNRDALMCITIHSVLATLSGLSVQYLNSFGSILETWAWSGVLLPAEKLVVDTNGQSVIHHQSTGPISNSWANFSITTGTGFVRVIPGISTIRIAGAIAGGQLDLDFRDTWA